MPYVMPSSSGRVEPQGWGRAQTYVRVNLWPFYLSWFLSFGMIIALSCSERLRKQYPLNICFLVRKHPALSLAFYIFPGHLFSKLVSETKCAPPI